jgi:hypothetical protein
MKIEALLVVIYSVISGDLVLLVVIYISFIAMRRKKCVFRN